jgi:hypothetical protein
MLLPTSSAPQRRGTSNYTNGSLPLGVTVIVSAGANTTGLLVRTLFQSGTANLTIGGVTVASVSGTNLNYFGPGFLVPPGVELAVNAVVAGAQIVVSWDVL